MVTKEGDPTFLLGFGNFSGSMLNFGKVGEKKIQHNKEKTSNVALWEIPI